MIKTRVLIADDHAMVRAGFRTLLAAQPDIEVIGEASDGVTVVGECQRLKPDIVLLDLTMPGRGGICAIEDLRMACPAVKVLVVTMHEDEVYARQALLAGAAGYVLKKALASELLIAIRGVHCGQTYIASSLARAVAQPKDLRPHSQRCQNATGSLTAREREVLSLAALGYTYAEIASRLHISDRTVETHRKNISAKLGLHTRAEMVRFALDHGLINS